ncbi:excalibur calcium-binding domain-containing protein [Buchananella hordeovulneris]|nr:excalibur calcium-binding domain-containing protein [Buchananella hordeovulneris]
MALVTLGGLLLRWAVRTKAAGKGRHHYGAVALAGSFLVAAVAGGSVKTQQQDSASFSAPVSAASATATPSINETVPGVDGLQEDDFPGIQKLADGLPLAAADTSVPFAADSFGPASSGHFECATLLQVLQRDVAQSAPAADGCSITAGTFTDPYSGQAVTVAGSHDQAGLTLDHVVSPRHAWGLGGQSLTPALRAQLATDPLNLLVVSKSASSERNQRAADEWLPSGSGRCTLAARQVKVKTKYHLAVSKAEAKQLSQALAGCQETKVAAEKKAAAEKAAAEKKAAEEKAAAERKAAEEKAAAERAEADRRAAEQAAETGYEEPYVEAPLEVSQAEDVYFNNCREARAAGYVNIFEGEPGYRRKLDRDGDGIACEQ